MIKVCQKPIPRKSWLSLISFQIIKAWTSQTLRFRASNSFNSRKKPIQVWIAKIMVVIENVWDLVNAPIIFSRTWEKFFPNCSKGCIKSLRKPLAFLTGKASAISLLHLFWNVRFCNKRNSKLRTWRNFLIWTTFSKKALRSLCHMGSSDKYFSLIALFPVLIFKNCLRCTTVRIMIKSSGNQKWWRN